MLPSARGGSQGSAPPRSIGTGEEEWSGQGGRVPVDPAYQETGVRRTERDCALSCRPGTHAGSTRTRPTYLSPDSFLFLKVQHLKFLHVAVVLGQGFGEHVRAVVPAHKVEERHVSRRQRRVE